MKTYLTTIEINDIPTEVKIHYYMEFGEPTIGIMTDVHTGDSIAPDLLGETDMCGLLSELHEANESRKKFIARLIVRGNGNPKGLEAIEASLVRG